jgi:enamine deaminase RidA (YjgF/YER057c/UK114 family)
LSTQSRATAAVQAILPVKLGPGELHYAQGIVAGQWLFVTGLLAQDFETGIPDSVVSAAFPQFASSPGLREATLIFEHLDRILTSAGSKRDNIVRVDQFFTDLAAIPAYQSTRRTHLGATAPASTSVLMDGLPLLQATMQVDVLAVIESTDFESRAIESLGATSASGPSPSIVVGDFVFISGQLATADAGRATHEGLAEEAHVPTTAFWGGQPIRAEADYVLRHRIAPALECAGSSARNVVKAQVYLTHHEDLPAFRQLWAEYFGDAPPATTIIVAPKRSMGLAAARVEINIIALRDDGLTRKDVIDCDVAPAYAELPAAVRAGDLVFLSGLMANDRDGVAPAVETAGQPLYGSRAETQAAVILQKAEAICAAAKTSLGNVVRAQHFHSDITEFYAASAAWRQRLGEQPLPLSAIGIPAPLPIPGCSILMDLSVYAPEY